MAKPSRYSYVAIISLTFAVLLVAVLELSHCIGYGHLVGYGLHMDVVTRKADLGIPGVQTAYGLILSNLTARAVRFEAIRLPGGFAGTGYIFHDQIQKWDNAPQAWVVVADSVEGGKGTIWEKPSSLVTLRPGRRIWPIGWDALAATRGISPGDSVRIVLFASFNTRDSGQKNALRIYSPSFVIKP